MSCRAIAKEDHHALGDMSKYLILEVLLPGALVFVTWWPGQAVGLDREAHLFLKVFASGDLLPICLLILVGAFLRTERASETLIDALTRADTTAANRQKVRDEHATLRITRYWIIFIAAGLALAYLVIKVNVLPYTFPHTDDERAQWWVYLCTIIDLSAFVLVSIFGCSVARLPSD